MKLRAVLWRALLMSTLGLLPPRLAAADQSHEVLLLEPENYPERWQEAEHRVAAELETSGFRVVRRPIHAATQEELMRQLLNSAPSFASFVMVREGKGGAALVWLAGNARIKHFTIDDVSSSSAAGAIALRVTEMLNMQVLTIAVPVPAAEPETESTRAEPSEAPAARESTPADVAPRPHRGMVWFGPSAVVSSDANRPGGGGALGIGIPLTELLSLEAAVDLVPIPLIAESTAGTTELTSTSARLFGQLNTALGTMWRLGIGLGAGVIRVASHSEPAPGFEAQSATTSAALVTARGRVQLETEGGFSALLSIDPALALPAISIRADNTEVARLGRPWVTGTLALGWSF